MALEFLLSKSIALDLDSECGHRFSLTTEMGADTMRTDGYKSTFQFSLALWCLGQCPEKEMHWSAHWGQEKEETHVEQSFLDYAVTAEPTLQQSHQITL